MRRQQTDGDGGDVIFSEVILVSIMLGYLKYTFRRNKRRMLILIIRFSFQSLIFQDQVSVNMTYLVSVFIIFSLISTSMQKVTSIEKEKVTLQDEEDVKNIIGAFYDGLCLGDENCLRPISFCDESLGVVSTSTSGIFSLDGRCRPVTLVWVLVAMVGLAMTISSCCCCFLRMRLFRWGSWP